MTGDCHVRFCESGEAQSSLPLTKKCKKSRKTSARTANTNRGGSK